MAKFHYFPASAIATTMPVASMAAAVLALPANPARAEFKLQSANGFHVGPATAVTNPSVGLFVATQTIYTDDRYHGDVYVVGGAATAVLRVWETRH